MHARTTTAAALAVLALTLTACSSDDDSDQAAAPSSPAAAAPASAAPAGARHYETAQDIADALKAAGLTVSQPKEQKDASYITEVGGTPYSLTITDGDGPASGEAGINLFPNPEALAAWIPLSKQFGGIAVTDDKWAVSLPTRDEAARTDSERLAPKIAKALDGTVQQ
ncbi:hypothetical protein ABS735_28395 [Streptomyces sp. MMCC 100]|uniref:hypothetical protein n=1 Tax=Streptomyces sp. MMCC 100 TaxID=3163555 RepID=UPI003594ADDC